MDDVEHRRRRIRTRRGTAGAETPPPDPAEAAAAPEDAPVAPAPPVRSEPPRPAAPVTDSGPARHRGGAGRGGGAEPAGTVYATTGEPAQTPARQPAERAAADSYDLHTAMGGDDRESERGLRGLVGGGSSQVGVLAAMRARDASRPTDADLAAAEANLTIVHRGWVPRDT